MKAERDGLLVKIEAEDSKIFKREPREESGLINLLPRTDEPRATGSSKRGIPEDAIIIDLVNEAPPRKRGRGRPRKNSIPRGADVIVIDAADEPLFL